MLHPVRSSRGMAVAPHALAAQSALSILRDGGNAVEAMVAAAATIAVVYPHMNGIGGDSFWLLGLPGSQGTEVLGIDACGAAGGEVRMEDYADRQAIPFRGPRAAITVAGTVSGWAKALEVGAARLGSRLPLARLLEDAIHYARHGCPVTLSQSRNTSAKRLELAPVHGFAPVFLPGGQVPQPGALFRQPRLADTLEQLARHGLDDFYRGELARSLAGDLASAGSRLRLQDLQAHEALLRAPLQLRHGRGRVFNMPPPTQGLVSLLILGIMDRLGAQRFDHLGPDFVHAGVEAAKQAFAVRDAHLTDPRHMRADAAQWLADAPLDRMAAAVDMAHAAAWGQGKGPADTVWMGVIDGQGRSVSMIQSIYHEFGSGVVLQGSGVCWQNRGASFSLRPGHINQLLPGKKPFHTLNPALALLDDGRTMVYGNMGGDGQPQSQSAVFTRCVVHGLDPQAAIVAPRWLLGRTWGQTSDTLKLEARFPAATVAALRERGHEVEVLGDFDECFGHAGCIVRAADGGLEGGFDPRPDGAVAAF